MKLLLRQRENICHGGILERKKHTLKWSHCGFVVTKGPGLPNPETWGKDLEGRPKALTKNLICAYKNFVRSMHIQNQIYIL